jgi:hypothetical protein
MVGLNSARSIADVRLDVQNRTLKLSLEFADTLLVCLERGADCTIKDHGAEVADRFDSPLFV